MSTTPKHDWPRVELHVVTGKGGTGKSTVAAALALSLASSGKNVLLCEVEGRQGIAQLFDVPPLPYEERKIAIDGKGTDLETTKVEDFLSKLSALRAQSFNPTTTAAGNAEPALVVSASYDTSKFERVRLIKGEKQMFGVRDGETGLAVVDQTAFDETMKALDAAIAPPAPPAPAPPAK